MPEIHPLRGWRYDTAVAGPLDELICPPYDVIAPAEAARLLEHNPRNAIRLEFGPGAADPLAAENRYRQAAATLQGWLADGTLRQDARPALYVYEQVFTLGGATLRRRAFLASVHLTPWAAGEVLPHEVTLATPKADRLALLEATRANISPIYALCDGALPGVAALLDVAAARPPDEAATDESGEATTCGSWTTTTRLPRGAATSPAAPSTSPMATIATRRRWPTRRRIRATRAPPTC